MTEPNLKPSPMTSNSKSSTPDQLLALPTGQKPSTTDVEIPAGVFNDPATIPQEGLTTDKPDSISELFAKYPAVDPEQARRVILELRKERAKLGEDQKPQKAPAKARTPKAPTKKISSTADLLAELGLDL